MRVIAPGQFLQGIQLEMTRQELHDFLHMKLMHPQEIVGDELEDKNRTIKRHFYIVQGQPITVYEIPDKPKETGESGETFDAEQAAEEQGQEYPKDVEVHA